MFYCKLCGPLSRVFLDEDDLFGHLNAQHRNWLSRNDYQLIVGKTEEDVANELNTILQTNEWKTSVSKRRPWYAESGYRGPKTLLEKALSRKEKNEEPTESSKQFYEEKIEEKQGHIEKLEGLLKMRTELAENALHVATKAVKKNDTRENRINWNIKPKEVDFTIQQQESYQDRRTLTETENQSDPLQHLFEGIQIRIDAAVDNAKTLKRTCEWKSKQDSFRDNQSYNKFRPFDNVDGYSQTGF